MILVCTQDLSVLHIHVCVQEQQYVGILVQAYPHNLATYAQILGDWSQLKL